MGFRFFRIILVFLNWCSNSTSTNALVISTTTFNKCNVSMSQQAKAYIWLSTSNPIFDSEATKFYLRRQKTEENTVVVVSLSYTIELLTILRKE